MERLTEDGRAAADLERCQAGVAEPAQAGPGPALLLLAGQAVGSRQVDPDPADRVDPGHRAGVGRGLVYRDRVAERELTRRDRLDLRGPAGVGGDHQVLEERLTR